MKESISRLHRARVPGVSFSIAFGLNAGSSGMRAGRCSGGSDVIGGEGITGWNFFSRTITRRDEKCSVS